MTTASGIDPGNAGALLRGESKEIAPWIVRFQIKHVWFCLATILIGAGLFGAALEHGTARCKPVTAE